VPYDVDESLPDLAPPITPKDVMRDRAEAVRRIVVALIAAIESRLRVEAASSHFEVDETSKDITFHFKANGIPSAAAPVDETDFAMRLWVKARDRWPEVLTGSGYVSLVMSQGLSELDADSFAEVFQRTMDESGD
jgi:hypothetical protein